MQSIMQRSRRGTPRSAFSILVIVLVLFTVMAGVAAISIFAGVKGFTLDKLPQIMEHREGDVMAYKIWDVRLPRTLLAILLGAALAVGGCLLQGITRNPLSDPEIMGINQGASFFVVAGLLLLGQKDVSLLVLFMAFLGAAVGGSVVYLLSFRGEYTATRLVLAGIAVSFFLGSMTTGLIILNETKLFEILYWMAGKLSGANWTDIRISLVCLVPAILISWLFARPFNVLSLGHEAAQGLGQRIAVIRRLVALLMIVLVGGAVALAGPIGFVGLMVPHMSRQLVGSDYRLIIPISALIGANLLLFADVAGQWMLYPVDTPVGIITALLGTPFFLYLLRRKNGGA